MRVKSGRRWLFLLTAVSAFAVFGCVTAAYLGVGPLAAHRMTETQLQPQVIRLLGEGGDPLVVMVGVTWTKDGYCSGQFTATATETATEIRTGAIISREYRFEDCAGIGTTDNMAWAELRLAMPLGNRVVVRESDEVRLPVLAR
jgi:hypothetical protein